jgi:hypothetical protein
MLVFHRYAKMVAIILDYFQIKCDLQRTIKLYIQIIHMRQILFGAIIISILTNCSEKETLTIKEEIQKLNDQPQIFTIAGDKTDTVKAKNGTIVIIRPNTFMFDDGQEAKGPIRMELKEVFDKPEMILNGLATTSDGRLLESFGMIYLRATADGKELKIKNNAYMTVSIPNKQRGEGGELFYGVQTDSLLNWKYAGTTKDSTEVKETYSDAENGPEIKETTSGLVDKERQIAMDSTIRLQGGFLVVSDNKSAEPIFYNFDIGSLGWINADRFIKIREKVNVEIELKTYHRPIGYLVFTDFNSVMEIDFYKGIAIQEDLPKYEYIQLIVIDKIDDHYFWAKKSVTLGSESKVTIETKKVTKEEIVTELKRLDQ